MATAFLSKSKAKHGLFSEHAYSLMFIKSLGDLTFVKLRNPWGRHVWSGNWSF
jgi:hypothetical protein